MIKAVIFDIDGTLVDSVDLHAQAWKEAFKHFGKDIPFEQIRHQIGKGGDQLMPVFFSKEELEELGEELEEYRSRLFKRDFLPRVRPFPKVRDLFERIKADDKRIALASSAKEDELEACDTLRSKETGILRRRIVQPLTLTPDGSARPVKLIMRVSGVSLLQRSNFYVVDSPPQRPS